LPSCPTGRRRRTTGWSSSCERLRRPLSRLLCRAAHRRRRRTLVVGVADVTARRHVVQRARHRRNEPSVAGRPLVRLRQPAGFPVPRASVAGASGGDLVPLPLADVEDSTAPERAASRSGWWSRLSEHQRVCVRANPRREQLAAFRDDCAAHLASGGDAAAVQNGAVRVRRPVTGARAAAPDVLHDPAGAHLARRRRRVRR